MVIVAAVDRSDRAEIVIKEAESLARAFDDTIHIVHVLSQSEFVDMERTHYDNTGASIEMDEIRSQAEKVAKGQIKDTDVSHETIGLIGDAKSRIVSYANEVEARYIVIAGRKRSPVGKAVFGSTTQGILLNAERPVVATFDH